MDATHLNTVNDALIDDLAVGPPPADDADRRLFDLLDRPRRVLDEQPLLAVLAAAVVTRNLADHVIAQAVAAAYRAARVGRAAHTLLALTRAQRLGGIGIEFADAIGKGVAQVSGRVASSEEDRAGVVTSLMIQTTPSGVDKKAREIDIFKAATQPRDDGAVPV